mmetsp:Transcript_57663/g.167011  ORF Transcript_57663/g.167011 Transcript_57663/m.167011 type:complete len:353 (-) Transcript_57663:59-1117(-)
MHSPVDSLVATWGGPNLRADAALVLAAGTSRMLGANLASDRKCRRHLDVDVQQSGEEDFVHTPQPRIDINGAVWDDHHAAGVKALPVPNLHKHRRQGQAAGRNDCIPSLGRDGLRQRFAVAEPRVEVVAEGIHRPTHGGCGQQDQRDRSPGDPRAPAPAATLPVPALRDVYQDTPEGAVRRVGAQLLGDRRPHRIFGLVVSQGTDVHDICSGCRPQDGLQKFLRVLAETVRDHDVHFPRRCFIEQQRIPASSARRPRNDEVTHQGIHIVVVRPSGLLAQAQQQGLHLTPGHAPILRRHGVAVRAELRGEDRDGLYLLALVPIAVLGATLGGVASIASVRVAPSPAPARDTPP